MPIYNKLVRDKIPEIIEKSGKQFSTSILNDKDYIKELKNKLNEEIEEYHNAKTDEESLEELADVLEIMHALVKVHDKTMVELEGIRAKKVNERGGFNDKVFLIEVEDE